MFYYRMTTVRGNGERIVTYEQFGSLAAAGARLAERLASGRFVSVVGEAVSQADYVAATRPGA